MEDESSVKESGESIKECVSLTDSPYVGGNKMSSSLKDRLKRSRMYSSPISRPVLSGSGSTVPVAPRSIKFANFANAKIEKYPCSYSQEEIENAMNEPEPVVKKSYSNEADKKININVVKNLDPVINENTWSDSDHEIIDSASDESDLEIINSASDESDPQMNENDSDPKIIEITSSYPDPEAIASCSYSEQGIKNGIVKPHLKINEHVCSYSKEDIENCEDKQELLEKYSNLQKEVSENEDLLRKLKLVQKHHTKNNPDALTDLTQKWLTCTQLVLRKLYSLMPEPRSVSFENFLIFLQVDFDIVKYNPESDTFS